MNRGACCANVVMPRKPRCVDEYRKPDQDGQPDWPVLLQRAGQDAGSEWRAPAYPELLDAGHAQATDEVAGREPWR